jgi:SAM-dependent methyltransferase
MQMLARWLAELDPAARILDLGCGSGSLRSQLEGRNVFGVDLDPHELARTPALRGVVAMSNRLPFRDSSFDLVISNHSMEHFADASGAIAEIGRVLAPGGRLFVSVPEGASFADGLYRAMFCGGDHFQRFTFPSLKNAVESSTALRLVAWKELSTSFTFVEKLNFIPAPRGRLPGPLPRRMRWMGTLPAWFFDASRIALNVASRAGDRLLGTHFSRYGWAFAFDSSGAPVIEEPGCLNVCMSCGSGIENAADYRAGRFRYRCPECSRLNPLFRSRGEVSGSR